MIKHRSSELVQQASALITAGNPHHTNSNRSDVVLTGKEQEAQQRQLAARPRVVIGPMDTRQQEQMRAAQQRHDTQPLIVDKVIYVSDRTKQWVKDNNSQSTPDRWKCLICHWDR